jgi:predicted transposase/invertase (TIGR01784 family)
MSFISAATGLSVSSVQLLPNEPPVESLSDKNIRFDVHCTFNDGTHADIEMQGSLPVSDKEFDRRIEVYTARLVNHTARKSKKYGELCGVWQISVLDFVHVDNERLCNTFVYCTDDGMTLSNLGTIVFIELPKLEMKKDSGDLRILEKWAIFLKEAGNMERREYVKQVIESEEGLKMALEALYEISEDERAWKAQYDRETAYMASHWPMEALELELQEAKAEVSKAQAERDEAVHRKALEDARNLRSLGVSDEIIAQATGLSVEEIATL